MRILISIVSSLDQRVSDPIRDRSAGNAPLRAPQLMTSVPWHLLNRRANAVCVCLLHSMSGLTGSYKRYTEWYSERPKSATAQAPARTRRGCHPCGLASEWHAHDQAKHGTLR